MDEAAERDYCTREWSRILKDKQEPAIDWLMGMRGQVREENQIELAFLRKDVEDWKRRAQAAEKALAAAQTEIERLENLAADYAYEARGHQAHGQES